MSATASATSTDGRQARRSSGPARRSAPPIRWDRLGRIAMLIVICVLVYLYVSAGTSILSTWRSAASYRSQVAAMERQNRQLNGELTQLARPQTVVEQGRALGLARSTEVPFFTTGLPGN